MYLAQNKKEQNCLCFDIPKIQEGFSKQLEYLVEHKSNHATTCIVHRYLRLHYIFLYSELHACCCSYKEIITQTTLIYYYIQWWDWVTRNQTPIIFFYFGLGFDKCLDAQPPEEIIFKNSFLIYLYQSPILIRPQYIIL